MTPKLQDRSGHAAGDGEPDGYSHPRRRVDVSGVLYVLFVAMAVLALVGVIAYIQHPSQMSEVMAFLRIPAFPAARQETRLPTATKKSTPTQDPAGQHATGVKTPVVTEDILKILTRAGMDPANGRVIFNVPDSILLTAASHNEEVWQSVAVGEDIADFAFHSNITWTTDLGFSGCGFDFRMSGADRSASKYYEFYFNRLSGAPYYLMNSFDSGTWMRRIGDGYSAVIREEQGAENELLFIGIGGEFRIFFNGKRVNVLYDQSLDRGSFGLYTFTNAGKITCEFADTWIWTWDE